VTSVCSARNRDLVRSTGAHRVIDYSREDVACGSGRYDVVFDLVGNRSVADCRRVLTPTGTLVLSGGATSRAGTLFGPMGHFMLGMVLSRAVRKHRVVTVTVVPNRANLATLRRLTESGKGDTDRGTDLSARERPGSDQVYGAGPREGENCCNCGCPGQLRSQVVARSASPDGGRAAPPRSGPGRAHPECRMDCSAQSTPPS
jgi:hypothetical protein